VNNASAALPGTIGLTGPIFAAVNEQVAEQLIVNGFKNVVLLAITEAGNASLRKSQRSWTRSTRRRVFMLSIAVTSIRKPAPR